MSQQAAATQQQRGVTPEQLQNWFQYHTPNEQQIPKYQKLREAGKLLATAILECTPPGPDQTAAIRKVREAIMTSNQAIACDG